MIGIGSSGSTKTPNACIPGREAVPPKIPCPVLPYELELMPEEIPWCAGRLSPLPHEIITGQHLHPIDPGLTHSIGDSWRIHHLMRFEAIPGVVL